MKGGSDIPEDRLRSVIVAAALLLTVLSCSYGFRGSLPEHLQSVKVAPFRSRVSQYGLEQELTSRVTEKIVTDGVSEGVFTTENPAVASWFVLGGLHALELAFTDRTGMTEAVMEATECALRALGCQAPPGKRSKRKRR